MPWNPDALRRLRARRGLTQQKLGDAAGAHRVTIANLETGDMQPGIDLLEALARALRVKVTDLLTTPRGKGR